MREKGKKEQAIVSVSNIPKYDFLFTEEENFSQGKHRKKGNGFIKKILKINAVHILINALLFVIQSLPVYVIPLVTANVINLVTEAVATDTVNQEFWLKLATNGVIVAISILQNFPTTKFRQYLASKMIRRTSAGIRCVLVRKLQCLSITYHKNMQMGRVQSKFIKDTEHIDSFLSILTHSLIPSILQAIIAVIISVITNGYVALFFLLVVPINASLVGFFRNKLRKMYREHRIKAEDMSAKLTTMMTMIPVTKSHGLEQNEIADLDDKINNHAKTGVEVDKQTATFGIMIYVTNTVLQCACLFFCIYLASQKLISVGDIVLYQSMFTQISGGITGIINSVPMLNSGAEAVRSVSEVMNAKDVELNMGKIAPKDIDGDITFEKVSFKYPDTDFLAIKDFSFAAKKGECVAFVGASGSGKTTAMNLIIGFMQATEGKILIDGKDIKEYNLSEYRHNISVVPQSSILFPDTIRKNITYGLDTYTEEELLKAVEMANINEFINDLPFGLETNVGEYGDKLSGGQKQRITIARALIRNPKILILDEATSSLDNISELHVQKAISSSIKGRTTFIVAHRLSTIRDADKIIVLDHGECIESGTYDELMAKKGKFYELKLLSDNKNKSANVELGE